MRSLSPVIALATLALAASAQAAGSVEVKFVGADKFSDAGRGSVEITRTAEALGQYLQSLGKKLPDGQVLKVSITDIDLAGELQLGRTNEVRVVRGRADWPRIELSYTLEQGGDVLKSGQAKLADLSYTQTTPSPRRNEAYGYERYMLERWFNEQFGVKKARR